MEKGAGTMEKQPKQDINEGKNSDGRREEESEWPLERGDEKKNWIVSPQFAYNW